MHIYIYGEFHKGCYKKSILITKLKIVVTISGLFKNNNFRFITKIYFSDNPNHQDVLMIILLYIYI